jgi:hypothetical protein
VPKKIRIDAASLGELRAFLSDGDVDLGCRPFARKLGERFSVVGVADDADIARLSARVVGGVRIEVLEELPPPEARLRMVQPRNRFLRGDVPRGLGRKA